VCPQKGFTLLELMVIVAIIGILASLAVPAFRDYTVRSKMSEVILALSSCHVSITEVYQIGSAAAPGPNGWGCESGASSGTKYVASVTTSADGVVSATVRGIATAVNSLVVAMGAARAAGARNACDLHAGRGTAALRLALRQHCRWHIGRAALLANVLSRLSSAIG
jgi:type IV pilus assembly protein PilA